MEPSIVRHGINYIFSDTKITHITCPECDFVSKAIAGNWNEVWIMSYKGKEVGIGYECPRCLCRFEYKKE